MYLRTDHYPLNDFSFLTKGRYLLAGEYMIDLSTLARPLVAKMVIDGRFVAASQGEIIPVYEPATNQLLASIPKGTLEDVERAVTSAQAAYESQEWQKMSAN